LQSQAIPYPEQVVCGPECAWAITAGKGKVTCIGKEGQGKKHRLGGDVSFFLEEY